MICSRKFSLFNRRILLCLHSIVLLLLLPMLAHALEINKLIMFGDSLSDDGNLAVINPETFPPGSPYYEGRFSNGPVWGENVAAMLNFKRDPHHVIYDCATRAQFSDCAYGGAMVAPWVPISVSAQVASYIAQTTDDKEVDKHLFVVWGGAIDYLMGLDNVEKQTNRTLGFIFENVKALIHVGARNIMLPNLPDIGVSPAARNNGPIYAKRMSELSRIHNEKLSRLIDLLKISYPEVKFMTFDVYGTVNDMIKNPAKYHLTNVQDACLSDDGVVCKNPDEYLFFDHLHPTKQVHQIFAKLVYDDLISRK